MTTVSIRLDDQDKHALDSMCRDMGMNLSTFFTIYAKKAIREKRIPFEINVAEDPFYSEKNMRWLDDSWAQIQAGKVVTKTIEELEAMTNA